MPEPSALLLQLDWDTLRVRFKRLQAETNNVHQNWQIRVHRSMSWIKRAAELPIDQPDLKVILYWIGLNALYAEWDAESNAPARDTAARRRFLQWAYDADQPLIDRFAQRYRPLIKKLLENCYLSNTFWRDPANPKAKGWSTADANYLDRNLRHGGCGKVVDQALERLYVLRGQLMHGAATGGGRLNRATLRNGLQFLELLVPLLIHIMLERGCHDDWPDLCYPPLG